MKVRSHFATMTRVYCSNELDLYLRKSGEDDDTPPQSLLYHIANVEDNGSLHLVRANGAGGECSLVDGDKPALIAAHNAICSCHKRQPRLAYVTESLAVADVFYLCRREKIYEAKRFEVTTEAVEAAAAEVLSFDIDDDDDDIMQSMLELSHAYLPNDATNVIEDDQGCPWVTEHGTFVDALMIKHAYITAKIPAVERAPCSQCDMRDRCAAVQGEASPVITTCSAGHSLCWHCFIVQLGAHLHAITNVQRYGLHEPLVFGLHCAHNNYLCTGYMSAPQVKECINTYSESNARREMLLHIFSQFEPNINVI